MAVINKMNAPLQNEYLELARWVLKTEAETILNLPLDKAFIESIALILACTGRVISMGIGKSGHIARKIAATLASTGTPAFFLHPTEACHGDMGMITEKDLILMLSNSGESHELLTLSPLLKTLNVPLILMTGNPSANLSHIANVCLHIPVEKEACPLGLAPTSSTTASLALGDALAIVLLKARGFSTEDFARTHPAGQLGRRLCLHITDIMRTGEEIPRVLPSQTISEALIEMTAKRLGMTTIIDEEEKLLGIFTDGDLRRALSKDVSLNRTLIATEMTKNPKTLPPHLLAIESFSLMEKYKITSMVITDNTKKVCGVIHLHDILKAGIL